MDQDTVRRIASLSRLNISEQEGVDLARDMQKILTFVEKLQEVDTDGVAPMTGPSEMNLRRRTDHISDGDKAQEVLTNAPESAAGYFVVPKVVE